MTALADIIRRQIRAHGPMDVGTYMALCLSHPEHGYYMKRDPLGGRGDFTTAPEISQLFGEMIGVFMADSWIKLGCPAGFHLIECGPGRGTLMKDIWRATRHVPGFHAAASVHLMEISPSLRAVQKETLSDIPDLCWHEDFLSWPDDAPLLVVANEWLDALPFRQALGDGTAWRERVIDVDLRFVAGLPIAPRAGWPAPEAGRIIEFSPARESAVQAVGERIAAQGGVALWIDYGHMTTAAGDTFQAVKNHRFVSVFETPGDRDLTSHVDFGALRDAAKLPGGFVTQQEFLMRLGIDVRFQRLGRESLRPGYDRLIGKDAMGELFKVMALCHNRDIQLAGFP